MKMTTAKTILGVAFVGILTGCGSAPATPTPTAPNLTISQPTATVLRNTALALTVTAQAGNGVMTDVTQQAAWNSSNPAVATVSSGVVTVKALGTAEITASYGGRSVTSRVTGQRRTYFDGDFTLRDAGGQTSIVGTGISLDDQLLYDRWLSNPVSGGSAQLSITVRGAGPDKPIAAGSHQVSVFAYLERGTFEILALSTGVTVYDADTGEVLLTIPLEQKRAESAGSTPNGANGVSEASWTLTVPSFIQ